MTAWLDTNRSAGRDLYKWYVETWCLQFTYTENEDGKHLNIVDCKSSNMSGMRSRELGGGLKVYLSLLPLPLFCTTLFWHDLKWSRSKNTFRRWIDAKLKVLFHCHVRINHWASTDWHLSASYVRDTKTIKSLQASFKWPTANCGVLCNAAPWRLTWGIASSPRPGKTDAALEGQMRNVQWSVVFCPVNQRLQPVDQHSWCSSS